MKMKLPKVLQSFKKSAAKLSSTALAVSANVYSLAIYTDLPVTKVQLDAKIKEWQGAGTAQSQGGTLATALKKDIEAELVEMLCLIALYVQLHCGGLVANVLAAGYEVVSDRTASTPLPKPESVIVDNSMTGKIVLKTRAIRGSRCYLAQYALVDEQGTVGAWQDGGFHTKCREIAVTGLESGKMYALCLQAVGGSTGASEWSNVVSGRCM